MTHRVSLLLELLGTRYSIECDERWTAFLSDLWRPFLRSGQADEDVQINLVMEEHWVARIEGSVEGAGTDPWWIAEQLRHFLVDHSLRNATDYLDLHAAVVTRGDAIVLFAGPSGTGKTTLTLSLIAGGWRHMSDDVAPIHRRSGDVVAFPKPISVRKKETWERWAVSWQLAWPAPPTNYFLLPAWLLPLELNGRQAPTHLFFPRYVPGHEVRAEQVTTAEAASRCGEYLRTLDPPRLADLVRLCGSVPAMEVVYGDSEEAARLIEDGSLPRS